MTLEIKPYQLDNSAVKQRYEPNPGVNVGIYLKYKYVGVSIGTNQDPEQSEIDLKGQSKFQDYQFHFAFEQVGFDLFYQKYKGFYRASAPKSEWEGEPLHYPLLHEMTQETMGISVFLIKSPRDFSYEAVFNQSYVQKKSGGSFLLFLSLNRFTIKNDGPFLPADQQTLYGDVGSFDGLKMTTLGAMFGWGHAFVFNRLFLGITAALGPAYQVAQYAGTTYTDKSQVVGRSTLRLSLGYNGSSYFAGMSALADATQSLNDTIEVVPSTELFELFIGKRF